MTSHITAAPQPAPVTKHELQPLDVLIYKISVKQFKFCPNPHTYYRQYTRTMKDHWSETLTHSLSTDVGWPAAGHLALSVYSTVQEGNGWSIHVCIDSLNFQSLRAVSVGNKTEVPTLLYPQTVLWTNLWLEVWTDWGIHLLLFHLTVFNVLRKHGQTGFDLASS